MDSLRRKAAWSALLVLAATYLVMLVADFRYFGAPVVPIHLGALAVYYLPWWFGWLPLVGVWLLFEARRVGGGRWGWRWWCGGLLVATWAWSLWSQLSSFHGGPNFWAEPYQLLREIPVLLAIGPLWILASGRRTAG